MISKILVIKYNLVIFGAALSQDKSAHFYCYNCTSDGYN